MGLFGLFKRDGRSQAVMESHAINVTKGGVFVDGALISPWTAGSLSAVFGEPRIVPPEMQNNKSGKYILLWDCVGARVYTKDLADGAIEELDVMFYDDPDVVTKYDKTLYHPGAAFSGTFSIDGKPLLSAIPEKELQKAYIFINDIKRGNWKISFHLTKALGRQIKDDDKSTEYLSYNKDNAADIIRGADTPFSWAYITYKEPRVSTGKYLHKKPDGEILTFKNLNFKLAIVQELMYNQRLMEPVFDVHDFAEDYARREIDVNSEGDEVIPEVKKWFQTLPVSAALAEKVESLYLDGGNEVYGQICPFWDGEDGMYEIKAITPEELAQFPNLKRIETPGIQLSPKVRKLLAANGIEVVDC